MDGRLDIPKKRVRKLEAVIKMITTHNHTGMLLFLSSNSLPDYRNYFLVGCSAPQKVPVSSELVKRLYWRNKRDCYRSEISAFPKRHTLRFPSAVSLKRLHEPQKCSDIDVMKPIFPR